MTSFILLLRCFFAHFFIFVRCKWFCVFLYLWNLFVKKIKEFKTDLITSFILLLTQKLLTCYTTAVDPKSKGIKWKQSNKSQAIQLDSSNCNIWRALTAPKLGLFHGIDLFYPRNHESYAAFRLSGQPILCELNCYVLRMK